MIHPFWNVWRRFRHRFSSSKPRRRFGYSRWLEMLEDRLAPAIITVNSALDNNNRDEVLTLREAISWANNTSFTLSAAEQTQIDTTASIARHTIAFDIPGEGPQVITPASSALPSITVPILIDGYSQPGATPNTTTDGSTNADLRIVLNGANNPAHGLQLAVSTPLGILRR